MSDARLDELLNAELDHELDDECKRELQQLLQSSDTNERERRAYRQLDDMLRGLPQQPVSAALRGRIAATVQLPAASGDAAPAQSASPWFSPVARFGLAAAAGVLLSIAVFNVIGPEIAGAPEREMLGSMVPEPGVNGALVLDQLQLSGTGFTAGARLMELEDRVMLDLDLDAAGPVEIEVDFSSTGLQFDSLAGGRIDRPIGTADASVLRLQSSGQREIRIYLRRGEGATAATTAAIQLEVSSNGQQSQQGTLGLSH